MSKYTAPYNEIAVVNEEIYLIQDGPLFDEPMARKAEDLFEVERDEVQKMMKEVEQE